MPDAPASRPPPRFGPFRLLLPLVGAIGIAALWALLGVSQGRVASAFAFVAMLDLLLMVRLARLPRGNARGVVAAAGTALAIVLAQWWASGARVGGLLGMMPWEGIPLMGPGFAWTVVQMSHAPLDWGLYASAVVLAGWLGR